MKLAETGPMQAQGHLAEAETGRSSLEPGKEHGPVTWVSDPSL
jgi:hypothetical protein